MLNIFPIGGRSRMEFLELRRHSDPSCSSSLENRKPQANDGNIREFCSGGGGPLLLLPGGAFSPAYKREYTAVPLKPGAALCMYATCIHGSLARSRRDKREIPTSLRGSASTGPSWAQRCAGVGGTTTRLVVAYDWSVLRGDWPIHS